MLIGINSAVVLAGGKGDGKWGSWRWRSDGMLRS